MCSYLVPARRHTAWLVFSSRLTLARTFCRLRDEVATADLAPLEDARESFAATQKAPRIHKDLSHELSFEVHEKSITRRLTVQCPARFSIQQNQNEEQYWITADLFRKGLNNDFHSKVVRKNIQFCRTLRDVYQVPKLYCRPHRGADELANMTADLRSQPSQTLVEWLQTNHLHKKQEWARRDGVSPRTQCWEPTVLARRKTAEIWADRLAADGGVKTPAHYLHWGAKLPPRRHTLENRSRVEPEMAAECGTWRSLPVIAGAPSPRRVGGGNNEIPLQRTRRSTEVAILRDDSDVWNACSSPRQALDTPSSVVMPDSQRSKRTAAPHALRVAITTPRSSSMEKSIKSGDCFSSKPQKHTTGFFLIESWNVGGLELERSSVSNL